MHFPQMAQFSGVLIRAYFLRLLSSSEKSLSGQAEMQRPQPLHFSRSVIAGGLEGRASVSLSFPIAVVPAVSICFEGQGGEESTVGMRR